MTIKSDVLQVAVILGIDKKFCIWFDLATNLQLTCAERSAKTQRVPNV